MNWTREELIVAFELYCHTPFSKISSKDQGTVALADRLGRTPSAVAFKLANFARLDPVLAQRGIAGLTHGSKAEKEIWLEFHEDWEKLGNEADHIKLTQLPRLASMYSGITSKSMNRDETEDFLGHEVLNIQASRRGQAFFRRAVMASYNSTCCLSGYAVEGLLIASHIVPWAVDPMNRRNPANGLCLNALLDKLFDKGLMTICADYSCLLSPMFFDIAGEQELRELSKYHGKAIRLPTRFLPGKQFLDYHHKEIFID